MEKLLQHRPPCCSPINTIETIKTIKNKTKKRKTCLHYFLYKLGYMSK